MSSLFFSKRGRIRILSFTAALLLSLAVLAAVNGQRAKTYRLMVENSYQSALQELGETMSAVTTTLNKTLYVASEPMAVKLSTQLWRETSEAKSALSRLPVDQLALEKTYKFLSQVGEFSMALRRKNAQGEAVTQKEMEQLSTLCDYGKTISTQVQDTLNRTQSTALLPDQIDLNQLQSIPISGSAEDTEESQLGYPTLIYDGPFSDHLANRKPLALKGEGNVSKAQAKKTAAKILGTREEELVEGDEEGGTLPCFVFHHEEFTIYITLQGGAVAQILDNGASYEERLTPEEAVKKAESWLKDQGYGNMKSTYYAKNQGTCVINFAACAGNVVCYPDLVKVGVSMEDGSIVALDARGYLYHHHTRVFPNAKVTAAQAQKKLSPNLQVAGVQNALIPTEGGGEILAYEFHCKSKKTKEEILVYQDVTTGEEVDLLFLLYADNGVFTK